MNIKARQLMDNGVNANLLICSMADFGNENALEIIKY